MLRILLLNTDYPTFLQSLYRRKPTLALGSFDRQLATRNASLFGTADFMSHHLRAAGHEAIDVHANNRPLQEAWMAERGSRFPLLRRLLRRGKVTLGAHEPRFYDILAAQIGAFRPNIIYNHDIAGIPADRLAALKPPGCALVGQVASPLDPNIGWRHYDLVVSSLPNYIAAFRQRGVTAAYLPLAFERRILPRLRPSRRDIPLSFVGSVTAAHRNRMTFLEQVCAENPVEIWGDGIAALPADSAIRRRHRGAAWGESMYGVLARSQITLNKHIDISENYANNLRLFEATGAGACLLTDWKENLGELFEPGAEVLAYRSAEECLELARRDARDDAARERIAAAGAARCLSEHTYERRMVQLAGILERHFA
jgi:spore maturation protein CgeB